MCVDCDCRSDYQIVPTGATVSALRRKDCNYSIQRIIRRLTAASHRIFTVSFLFLSIVRLPHLTMAAPTQKSQDLTDSSSLASTSPTERRKAKWVNPCGINPDAALDLNVEYDIGVIEDFDLMGQVRLQAENALVHSAQFREEYVKKTFKGTMAEIQRRWEKMSYDWLPTKEELPKILGEQLTQEYLDSLNLEDTIKRIYEILQKFAVGLEQVVLDQAVYNADFTEKFHEAEHKLKAVLCELQVVMLEKKVAPNPDVTRQIMAQEIRDIEDESLRNLRDWLIFRDYMNGLEYTAQVFDHFQKLSKQPSPT